MARAEDFLGEVLSSFDLLAPVVGAVRFGQGHINDTFVVHTQPENRKVNARRVRTLPASVEQIPQQKDMVVFPESDLF